MTKKVNGKQKGNSFERKIANLLSKRFEKQTGVKNSFRRNPDSGSFFGGSNESRTETYNLDYAIYGDLICPRNFNFSVECKHYKSAPTITSLTSGNPDWDLWLQQARQDSINSNKKMLLIIKYNNIPELILCLETLQNVEKILQYRDYNVYLLSDLLSLPDTYFFT